MTGREEHRPTLGHQRSATGRGAGPEGHALPASVRVALWGTVVLSGGLDLGQVRSRALPDLDESHGLEDTLQVWRDLGERAVLVALPRPGDAVGVPGGSPELLGAATAAQECAFVPGVGGALVPELEEFGPAGDTGWIVRWRAFEADPVPTHRVQALDLGEVERTLRTALIEHTETLAAAGTVPFGGAADLGAARARAAVRTGALTGPWGLPDGIPGRAARVVDLAGTVLALTDAGLDTAHDTVDGGTGTARSHTLRQLQGQAARALADATNVAVLTLAGWR